jgi:hypothetical protein
VGLRVVLLIAALALPACEPPVRAPTLLVLQEEINGATPLVAIVKEASSGAAYGSGSLWIRSADSRDAARVFFCRPPLPYTVSWINRDTLKVMFGRPLRHDGSEYDRLPDQVMVGAIPVSIRYVE